MPHAATPLSSSRNTSRTHRWIRQIHLWIGAWGALAAVLYGFTGLMMNHRYDTNPWPQGSSDDIGKRDIAVPAEARQSAEALSLWLRDSEGLDAQTIRKPAPGEPVKGPARWTFGGGMANQSWSLEYKVGSDTAELKQSKHSTLAALNRLHKAVGGGLGWRILGDSFAISMILLGLSGLWMWARARSAKQMIASVAGASVTVMAVVLIANLL